MEFFVIPQILEAKTAKRIDPYCQQLNCSPPNMLLGDVLITLILLGIPLLGGLQSEYNV